MSQHRHDIKSLWSENSFQFGIDKVMNFSPTSPKFIFGSVVAGIVVLAILKRNSMGGTLSSVKGRNGQIATSIFDFDVEDINSKSISMETFKGKKVYYVVNVATN